MSKALGSGTEEPFNCTLSMNQSELVPELASLYPTKRIVAELSPVKAERSRSRAEVVVREVSSPSSVPFT